MAKMLDPFTVGYIEAALFSSMDDQDVPLDENYGLEDISRKTIASMVRDCAEFQKDNWNDISATLDTLTRAGRDFWFTRNGHGAGFWDGDWPEDVAKRLTAYSHEAGGVDLQVHRKKIHSSQG